MSSNDILAAALDQNPIKFKEHFDEMAQQEIIKQGEAVRASILAGFSKLKEAKEEGDDDKDKSDGDDKNKKKDDDKGDDDEEDEDLEEQVIELNTVDPRATAKKLSGIGLKASTNPKDSDGVVVQIKDRADAKKLKSWMLDNGFDQVDLQDAYPEVLKAAK